MSRKILYYIVSIIAISIIGVFIFLYFNNQNSEPINQSSNNYSTSSIIESWHYQTREKFLSGQWTMEEYLINNLSYIVDQGDNQLNNNLPIDEIHPTLRGANIYLKNGQDESVKQKIKEYFKIIYSTANLEQSQTSNNSNLFSIETQAQSSSIVVDSFEAGGFTNQIIYPSTIATNESLNNLIIVATRDTMRKYDELGYNQIPIKYYYNTELYTSSSGELDEWTAASAFLSDSNEFCVVDLWLPFVEDFESSSGIIDDNELKQVIAHELYHCVQFKNFPSSENYPFDEWRFEGGADYFSNVVYPFTGVEDYRNQDFDQLSPYTPVYQMSYEANIFHQFLANNIGNDGLKTLYESMPRGGGFSSEQNALSIWPGIDDLFHDFAKNYLDGTIQDTSGASEPIDPRFDIIDPITNSRILRYEVSPFLVGRQQKEYQHNNGYFDVITTDDEGDEGKYNVKDVESGESWIEMPATVPQTSDSDTGLRNCNNDGDKQTYKVVMTNTSPSNAVYKLKFDITANDTEPPNSEEESTIDPALVGTWVVDEESARRAFDVLMGTYNPTPGNFELTNFDYNASICFRDDGTYLSDFIFGVDYNIDFSEAGSPPQIITSNMILSTSNAANYTANDGSLIATNINEIVIGQVTSTTPFGTTTFPLGQGSLPDEQARILYRILNTDHPTDEDDIAVIENLRFEAIRNLTNTPALQPDFSGNYTISGNQLSLSLPVSPNPEITATKVR